MTPPAACVHGNENTTGAVHAVESIAGALKWRKVGEPLEVLGQPSKQDLEACWELGATAAAQEATEPPAPRTLEEIVVTAQRKEETLQDVPVSVTAVSGEFFKEAGIDNMHELAEYTPGVFVTTNPCCVVAFVRCFGTPFAVSSLDPTVALVLDELLLPRDVYVTEPLYDVERFEVLRGPQGTLFGKNSPAGLFNVTSARPTKEQGSHVLTSMLGADALALIPAGDGDLPAGARVEAELL